MKNIFIFILFLGIPFVSAVDIDFDCPDEIFSGEEFECCLEVFDGDGIYDVKVDLDGERNSILEIWNGKKWLSGYYYFKDFIEDGDEEILKLRVSEEGDYEGVLKLRQGDKREFFDVEIEVLEGEEEDEVEDEEEDVLWNNESQIVGGEKQEEAEEKSIILLNGETDFAGNDSDDVDKLVYISKDAVVTDYLIYGFAIFLIFVIGILVWER